MVSRPVTSDTTFSHLFFDDALEQLAVLDDGLVRLEKEVTNIDLIQTLFRAIHTLKGSAATFGFDAVKDLAHAMESVLDKIWHHQLPVTNTVEDRLLQSFDLLRSIVETRQNTLDESQENAVQSLALALQALTPEQAVPGQAQVARRAEKLLALPETQLALLIQLEADCAMPSVRAFVILRALHAIATVVDVIPSQGEITQGIVDRRLLVILETPQGEEAVRAAVKQVGEVDWVRAARGAFAAGMWLEMPARDMRAPANADSPGALTIRVGVDTLSRLSSLTQQFAQHLLSFRQASVLLNKRYPTDTVVQGIQENASQLTESLAELQALVQQAYQMPVGMIFRRFPRMVRDLCHTLGKEVRLITTGEHISVERSILDQLVDPLMHLLRNAIDHGIELPAQRLAQGKPATGAILLSVAREPEAVIICVQDDGAGIDWARLAEHAVAAGYVPQTECKQLTHESCLELLFLPGVSTAETVTTISGRGVGMDVVKQNIDALGGQIAVDTMPGEGTSFTITVPTTARASQNTLSV